MEYHEILVAVDGSDEAQLAFEKAVDIAKRNEARLNIVHILDNSYFASMEALTHASIPDYPEKQGRKLLDEYKATAEAKGLTSVNIILEKGSPKALIPKDLAERVQADLIVCGATGIGGMERVFLGSVSERITRTAVCDVLVVRNL
ncbi:universal stress protein [Bacillus thermotolerans]|uniref:Universal stress protein n=1 Tax=Bacillus thermotolerans TaxID=1221996 RepID=A0A0F5I860_BACTR|nr:universal stress protein [Bacillus thermotolerans]KKB37367.1 Universal stress protein family [Bacillus thermotolerans]KKB41623.1 Universal stress protein family [Bacillus thermotolerans]